MELKHTQMNLLLFVAALPCIWAVFDRPHPFAAAPIKFSHTLQVGRHHHKLFAFPQQPMKAAKRAKYVFAGKLPASAYAAWKSALDGEKKQMGLSAVVVESSFRPSSIDRFKSFGEEEADIKPVTEHIEGDLMYDFRTNTHSI